MSLEHVYLCDLCECECEWLKWLHWKLLLLLSTQNILAMLILFIHWPKSIRFVFFYKTIRVLRHHYNNSFIHWLFSIHLVIWFSWSPICANQIESRGHCVTCKKKKENIEIKTIFYYADGRSNKWITND